MFEGHIESEVKMGEEGREMLCEGTRGGKKGGGVTYASNFFNRANIPRGVEQGGEWQSG